MLDSALPPPRPARRPPGRRRRVDARAPARALPLALLLAFLAGASPVRADDGAAPPAAPPAAPASLELSACLGAHDLVREGDWSYALFEIVNSGAEFAGVAAVIVPGAPAVFERELLLPPKSRRRVQVPFRGERFAGDVTLRVLRSSDGAVVWTREVATQGLGALTRLVLAYGRRAETLAARLAPDPATEGGGLVSFCVRTLAADALAESGEGYAAAHALLLSGVPDGAFTAARARALADWVRSGGHLIFVWEIGWHPETTLARDLAPPIELRGEAEIRELEPFRAFHPQPPPATGLAVADVTPAAGAETLFACGERPLAVTRRLGFGRVTWIGFDLARPLWTSWPGTVPMLRGWLDLPPLPPALPDSWSGAEEGRRLRELLEADGPVSSRLSPPHALFFSAVYALAAGPGLWWFFRRRRKGLAATLAFPAVVVGFSGFAFALSGALRATGERCRLLHVVEVAADGAAVRGRSYGSVTLPRRTPVEIAATDPTARLEWVQPEDAVFLAPGMTRTGSMRRTPDSTRLQLEAQPWASEFFEASWRREEGAGAGVSAGIAADASVPGGRVLRVDNRTGGPLAGFLLLGGREHAAVAALAPGVHLLPLDPTAGAPFVPRVNDPRAGPAVSGLLSVLWSPIRHELLLVNPLGPLPVRTPLPEATVHLFDARFAAGRRSAFIAWTTRPAATLLPLTVAPLAAPPVETMLFLLDLEPATGGH
ncbi:MAG: hypothetical protein HZA54_10940 [Planctomycetes bacterium]|nr:hypothetical protein [Planctomycetota bacterium]